MTIDRSKIPNGVRFSAMPEATTYDLRLSDFEHRVLSALLCKTPDWKVRATQLANAFQVNERTIRRALDNLEKCGYANAVRFGRKRVDTRIRPISKVPNTATQPNNTNFTAHKGSTGDSMTGEVNASNVKAAEKTSELVSDTFQSEPLKGTDDRTKQTIPPDISVHATGQFRPEDTDILDQQAGQKSPPTYSGGYCFGTTASVSTASILPLRGMDATNDDDDDDEALEIEARWVQAQLIREKEMEEGVKAAIDSIPKSQADYEKDCILMKEDSARGAEANYRVTAAIFHAPGRFTNPPSPERSGLNLG